MSADDPAFGQLLELGDCAYRLGKTFAEQAEHAVAVSEKVEFYRLFERCFFSVRMAISLRMRLRRLTAIEAIPRPETHHSETERPETERPDWRETEREREREREPASLPLLLRTLNRVADDAAALPGPVPAELPTLRELLAGVARQSVATARPVPVVQPVGGSPFERPRPATPPSERPFRNAPFPKSRLRKPSARSPAARSPRHRAALETYGGSARRPPPRRGRGTARRAGEGASLRLDLPGQAPHPAARTEDGEATTRSSHLAGP